MEIVIAATCGVFLGTLVGIFIMSLMVVSKRGESQ